MKRIVLIGSVIFMGLMMMAMPADAQSRKEKKAAKKAEWEFQQKVKEMERQRTLDSLAALQQPKDEVFQRDIPCYAESRSDKDFYRELGEGTDTQRNVARLTAVKMAQSMMRERLAHSVKGLSTDYTKLMNKSGKNSDMEQLMEGEFMSVVDASLNDADNPCERWSQDRSGNYHVYYVIEISKRDLTEKMANAITQNDQLKAEFDRDQFRKFADEYMAKQQDYQNNR
ncbi:MAG: hypothetical protein IJ524_07900 [Bacteroidales bacterium]|nr:hypothetical protein [Bacteroidales bacterium]